MDIYVKPFKKVSLSEVKKVYLKDVAEVYAPKEILEKIKGVKLMEIDTKEDKNYLISIIDIINRIDKSMPGHTINNVGEIDTIVEYSPVKEKEKSFLKTLKVIAVTIILLAGSSTAIMSFHSDAQMSKVFENYYYIFFNERVENPMLLDIPYSIGLAMGIIVFFNHFVGKKITKDPTPIEVEMSTYEANVTDNIIDTLNVEKTKGGNNTNGNN
nr:stage V sporulation protein AA [uncultured Tyzzerella sp.]